jgi:hypothetical protein
MKSLLELNGYSDIEVEYSDARTAGVLFDRPNAIDVSLLINENQTHTLPTGIEINDIVDYEVAQVYVELDFSTLLDSTNDPVQINTTGFPAHMTLSSEDNVYTIGPLQSVSDWLTVKSAVIQLPFGYSGEFDYTATISYFIDDSTQESVNWTVAMTVIAIQYLSDTTPYIYVPNTTASPNLITIIADTTSFNPIWTLTITPNQLSPITTMTSTATGGSFAFNATTKVATIIGSKNQVNTYLDNLQITFAKANPNFQFAFNLTNNINSDFDYQIQTMISKDLVSDMSSAFTQTGSAVKLRSTSATITSTASMSVTATEFEAYVRFNNYNPSTQTNSIIELEDSYINNPVSIVELVNPTLANVRLFFDLTSMPSGNSLQWTSLPSTVNVEIGPKYYLISGIDSATEFNACKNPLINIVDNVFNDYTIVTKVIYDDPTGADKEITFNINLDVTPYITFRDTVRTYKTNQDNAIFAGLSLPQIQDTGDFEVNHRLTFEVDSGDFDVYGSLASTFVLSDIPENINSLISAIKYYPLVDDNSTINLTITLEKSNGSGGWIPKMDYTTTITNDGEGSLGQEVFVYNTAGSYTIDVPLRYQYYGGKIDYVLVAGGGGAGSRKAHPTQANRFTNLAGGGGGQVKSGTNVNISNSTSIGIVVGAGGSADNNGDNSSIIYNNGSSSIISEGGWRGRVYNNYTTSPEYYNPSELDEVGSEGGKSRKSNDSGYNWGDYIATGNGWDVPISGAGAGSNSWVGLSNNENLGGAGINIDGVEYSKGGNGQYGYVLINGVPDILEGPGDTLFPASSTTLGSGGGTNGTVLGTVSGKNGYVKIVLKD